MALDAICLITSLTKRVPAAEFCRRKKILHSRSVDGNESALNEQVDELHDLMDAMDLIDLKSTTRSPIKVQGVEFG